MGKCESGEGNDQEIASSRRWNSAIDTPRNDKYITEDNG
jgi:hypothetical protein